MRKSAGKGISRRSLLVGGGAGVGLVVAWALWPRTYIPNLRAGPGETVFNGFLKIGTDGRVIIAVPQAETGQGVYTSLPQIVADELGADWRAIGVEPAPIGPLYGNALFQDEMLGEAGFFARRFGEGAAMVTGGSTSIRAFEPRLREAGAAARALLMQAAAERWDADWETLDTAEGFVVNGNERLAFAELAEEAAGHEVPSDVAMRGGIDNRLTGRPLPRIDLPAKVDGSAAFAADIRLPGMVFASVRQGPRGGDAELVRIDKAAADRVPGVLAVFENPRWAGAAATNWWAANQAVEAMKPVFRTTRALPTTASIEAALSAALQSGDAVRAYETDDAGDLPEGPSIVTQSYSVGLAANAPIEPLAATARMQGDRLEVWAPTQAPEAARAVAARAASLPESRVTIFPTLVGGGYGRKLETTAIGQVAEMAVKLKRPVQLTWSRVEETMQDTFRPSAQGTIRARVGQRGVIEAWHARIAAPATAAQVMERISSGSRATDGDAAPGDVAGAAPPYGIPAIAVDHVPADIGVETGLWRSGAHSYTCFFTECFIDELARMASIEPLSYRMQMLGGNPRLARVLSTAAALGGWDGGGPGSAMGLACHSAFGSHVATLVEIEMGEMRRPRVLRAVAAIDCGRVVNPAIVQQLIEGGIVHGISNATANPIGFEGGLPTVRHFGGLGLPRLADSPDVTVEIVESDDEPGGVTELGVPPIAPAIANAMFALTGQRVRSLPLVGAA